MDERSDQILVEQVRSGDRRAYEVLVGRHYRSVFAMCLGICGDPHESADLSQEAVLRGYLKIGELQDSGHFRNWLLQIAKNLSLDYLRRVMKDRKLMQNLAEKTKPQKKEDFQPLETALIKLPAELRIPLLLYYFDGKKGDTIARQLGISHSSACRRLKEAKQTLSTILAEQDGYHE